MIDVKHKIMELGFSYVGSIGTLEVWKKEIKGHNVSISYPLWNEQAYGLDDQEVSIGIDGTDEKVKIKREVFIGLSDVTVTDTENLFVIKS